MSNWVNVKSLKYWSFQFMEFLSICVPYVLFNFSGNFFFFFIWIPWASFVRLIPRYFTPLLFLEILIAFYFVDVVQKYNWISKLILCSTFLLNLINVNNLQTVFFVDNNIIWNLKKFFTFLNFSPFKSFLFNYTTRNSI